EHVMISFTGFGQAALSKSGTLVYVRGTRTNVLTEVRGGIPRPLLPDARDFVYPRYSPDGRRVAVAVRTADSKDVWVLETASGTLTRLTTDGSVNDRPEWTP